MRVVPVTWDVLTELVFNRTVPPLDLRGLATVCNESLSTAGPRLLRKQNKKQKYVVSRESIFLKILESNIQIPFSISLARCESLC